MRVVDASFFYDEDVQSASELLKRHYTTVGWAEALHRKGIEVIVVKRFHEESSFTQNGVQYLFVKDGIGPKINNWQIPVKFFNTIVSQKPDIVTVHHLSLSLINLSLRLFLKKKTSIIIQHHGGPTPHGFKKSIHDFINQAADGFFFTTIEQGEEWFSNKKMHKKILPVMEGSTFFDYENRDVERNFRFQPRNESRKITGMTGDPVFLWVGRLDDNKDPLTILDGFEIIFQKFSNASLYMIFNDNRLQNAVKNKINSSAILNSHVQLLGEVKHEEIKMKYASADFFVLGSHYEGSGYALSEALRCGCVPIVTNIPSFKMMTDEGRLGSLWQPGNKNSFAEATNLAMNKPLEQEAKACITFYNQRLAFDAIAESAITHYQKLINARQNKN